MKLRALEPQDIEDIYKWENDPEVWKFSDAHTHFSRHLLTQYILSATSCDIYNDKQLRLIGEVDDKAVGCVDLYDFDPSNHRAGIGILVDSHCRGKGYGRKMVEEMMTYCQEHVQLHMLYAIVAEDNEASLKMFESVGFTRSGAFNDWIYDAKIKNYKTAIILQILL